MTFWRVALWGVVCVPGCGTSPAARVLPALLADGLKSPTAVLPQTDGSFLVAESGAGRVVRIDADGNVTPFITGFDLGTFTPYDIGPLSLHEHADGLIVGEGGNPPGRERVSFYASDGTPTFEPMVPTGGGNFFGLAVRPSTGDLLIASATTNRVFAAPPADGGGFSDPVAVIRDTTEAPLSAEAPTALAVDSAGLLYVGFAGAESSKIVRIDMQTSFVETIVWATSAVTAIDFRPSDGTLFFSVFGEPERTSGVVFNVGTNGVVQPFAAQLAGPTSLAFGSDDTLYATTIGTPPNGATGQLLSFGVEPETALPTGDADTGTGEVPAGAAQLAPDQDPL